MLSAFIHHLFGFLLHLGCFGPFLLGVFDSSFLFLPFGNDLLVVILRRGITIFICFTPLPRRCGSTLGVLLLDLVARRLGEEGVTQSGRPTPLRVAQAQSGRERCQSAYSRLAWPRRRFRSRWWSRQTALSGFREAVCSGRSPLGRALRFLILGALAIQFGPSILHIVNSPGFKYFMTYYIHLPAWEAGSPSVNGSGEGRSGRSYFESHAAELNLMADRNQPLSEIWCNKN